jgi:hypothetical protein
MLGARHSQILWKISVLIEACLFAFPACGQYSGGSGTAQDPYQIATAADLIDLGETPRDYDGHFKLVADIDLDPKLPGGKVFDKALIAPGSFFNNKYNPFQGTPFTGVFDGNRHTISHLTIAGKDCLGLFGQLLSEAEVRNLGMVDVRITGSGYYAGGLVGHNRDGSVTHCYSTGVVRGGQYVGGLVGENHGAMMHCYSSSAVQGTFAVGGLVGSNYGGTVAQCYSTGAVSGNTSVGGLVAANWSWGTVSRCYSTGAVSGTLWVGGLVGENDGSVTHCYSTGAVSGEDGFGGLAGYTGGAVIGCFWDTQTSGQTKSAAGTGKTTAEMQRAGTFLDAGWGFIAEAQNGTSRIWRMPQGGGYPALAIFQGYTPPQLQGSGTAQDPYLVSNAVELGAMVYCDSYAHYRLVASVDLSGIRWSTAVVPWFVGTFDGDGHTISHLTITGGGHVGLFGRLLAGAEIRNLGVSDVNIIGSGDFVGGLVGESKRGTVTQCYGTGSVRSTRSDVGGLVGENYYGAVTQCYSTGAVSGAGQVGGLVGSNNEGTMTCCYSTGAVRGNDDVGGLVGRNDGGTVTQCCGTGSVRSTRSDVGGLMGENYYGTVTHCYSTGAVSGAGQVGGLVGSNNHGPMTRCYSTGAVRGNDDVGGLVGSSGNPDYVTASFWDTQTSGQTRSAAGTGKTTAEMENAKTFLDAGWAFVGETANGIWWIFEGTDYPRLGWQYGRAFALDPQESETNVSRRTVLRWMGGGPEFWQDVYLSGDEVAVADATSRTPGVYRTRQAPEISTYDPGILEWGQTYYWRVDEVHSNNPAAGPKGTVWSFRTTDCIKFPYPPDSGVDVVQPTVLSWVSGEPGLQYDVYFGEHADKVTGATPQTPGMYRGRQSSETTAYKAGDLKLSTTYYWRIDGVDKAGPQSPWKGTVWSFTTGTGLAVVDDFESYTNDEGGRIYEAWIDGWTNGTGSTVGNILAPFAEQTVVHGGRQSLPMAYDNGKKPWYSESQRTWATPQDWAMKGADTLTLYFRGEASNGRDPLYVGIEDSAGRVAAVVHPDAEAVRATEWQTWHIILAEVRAAGVNVAAVRKMAIGVGDRRNPKSGGTGRLYIDDIRLTKR